MQENKSNIALNNTNIKRERFIRIAERRVNKVLEDLDKLGKCSDKRNYKYDSYDTKKIFNEIEKKIKEIKILYEVSKEKKKRFHL